VRGRKAGEKIFEGRSEKVGLEGDNGLADSGDIQETNTSVGVCRVRPS